MTHLSKRMKWFRIDIIALSSSLIPIFKIIIRVILTCFDNMIIIKTNHFDILKRIETWNQQEFVWESLIPILIWSWKLLISEEIREEKNPCCRSNWKKFDNHIDTVQINSFSLSSKQLIRILKSNVRNSLQQHQYVYNVLSIWIIVSSMKHWLWIRSLSLLLSRFVNIRHWHVINLCWEWISVLWRIILIRFAVVRLLWSLDRNVMNVSSRRILLSMMAWNKFLSHNANKRWEDNAQRRDGCNVENDWSAVYRVHIYCVHP